MDILIIRYARRLRRRRLLIARRQLRDSQIIFEITTEQQFIDLYRFPKRLFLDFLNVIKPRFFTNERQSAFPTHLRFLCALRFFATGGFQRTVGQDFLACMSQTSIHRCIDEVSDILNEVSSDYVYFPEETEQAVIKEDFFEKASFPGIVGLMDGTHIKIMAPNRDVERAYYYRKGGHSINVLLVFDSKYIVRYANAKFPGTSHDAYIWRRSALQEFLRTKYEAGMRNFWLLGDSGFPQQPWLMTPFSLPPNPAQANYNVAHKKIRCMIERCIGLLKKRFRCVSSGRALHYNPTKAGKIINACIVLHNVLRRANAPLPDSDNEDIEEAEENSINEAVHFSDADINTLREGQRVRQNIVQTYFS